MPEMICSLMFPESDRCSPGTRTVGERSRCDGSQLV
jgi:hypothetical protein